MIKKHECIPIDGGYAVIEDIQLKNNSDANIIATIGIRKEGVPLIEEPDEILEAFMRQHPMWLKQSAIESKQYHYFKRGYKANPKQYTEAEHKACWEAAQNSVGPSNKSYEDYLKSLQKVPISVELEYEALPDLTDVIYNGSETNYGAVIEKLKITNPEANTIIPIKVNYNE